MAAAISFFSNKDIPSQTVKTGPIGHPPNSQMADANVTPKALSCPRIKIGKPFSTIVSLRASAHFFSLPRQDTGLMILIYDNEIR
jgi:hypothetical protein